MGEQQRTRIRDLPASERPRERLISYGPQHLSNAELLAIFLRSGTRGKSALEVAQELLRRYRSLGELVNRSYGELKAISGIGPAKAVTLLAAFELSKRIKLDLLQQRKKITSPKDVAEYFIENFLGVTQESFYIVLLTTAHHIIAIREITRGTLNSSPVHPREVFRLAITESAAAIIAIHNHPSGNTTPSADDLAITRRLVDAGNLIGIPLLDHLIIAGTHYVSLREQHPELFHS